MANKRGFKSDKRKKELARQKKQEEKRQKRFNKGKDEAGEVISADETSPVDTEAASADTEVTPAEQAE